jgi:hypothetical protein
VQVEFADLQREFARRLGRAGEHGLHDHHQPLLEARRASHGERCGAAAHELGVEQEEGQAGEMVAMQVAHQHGRNRVGFDLPFADRHHRGSAAVDQHVAVLPTFEMEAGIEAAAAAEGVAGAKELQAHRLVTAPAAGSTLRW